MFLCGVSPDPCLLDLQESAPGHTLHHENWTWSKKRLIASSIVIDIEGVSRETMAYPDSRERWSLLQGLSQGFTTGVAYLPAISYECRNLLSAEKFHQDTTNLIKLELDKGFLLGPFDHPPFPAVRINPVGVVESKYSCKKRLIVDMSAPHDMEGVRSMNDLIDKQDFSLSYVRIDDAIKIIKTLRTDTPIFLLQNRYVRCI
jgi:hypothetical protein